MEPTVVKQEAPEGPSPSSAPAAGPAVLIELSSSSGSDSEVEDAGGDELSSDPGKRSRVPAGDASDKCDRRLKRHKDSPALPTGFLDPLPASAGGGGTPMAPPPARPARAPEGSRQFWKAGDYEGSSTFDSFPVPDSGVGVDHVRVHPRFLHSNATSHKWALGAFAELLDNALDEVCHGATFVNIDVLQNTKDGSRMVMIEDDGGGMDPDNLRKCMSLGYSAKSKIANSIGQYGNGFKTSTMRLGADVIVFSRSQRKDGKSPTQSIGLLSYTFLRNTGKEDIIVPMLDYEKLGEVWHRMRYSSIVDWDRNIEIIAEWSPYSTEAELLNQCKSMGNQGTRILIYNLWEDDQGELELDFDTDKHDIQLGGVNRDEKKIEMATQYPNSRHFLTYRHSLRSYASILYLRLPFGFRIILRDKEIEHHNIVNDMMLKEKVSYRPQCADGIVKDPNVVAVVTMGFVKDAKHHIDVQGFNVYHKNRLIKPFWRVWNAAGSDGRGVIGVLEANFVEPAHDKQGFERTTILSRLETRLVQMQKDYWWSKCHQIGYAPRRNKKHIDAEEHECSPEASPASRQSWKADFLSAKTPVSRPQGSTNYTFSNRPSSCSNRTENLSPFGSAKSVDCRSGILPSSKGNNSAQKFENNKRFQQSRKNRSVLGDDCDSEPEYQPSRKSHAPSLSTSPFSVNKQSGGVQSSRLTTRSYFKGASLGCIGKETNYEDSQLRIKQLNEENEKLKERILKLEETVSHDLQLEREKNKLLKEKLEDAKLRLETASKEQEALVDLFAEERSRRDSEEENLRQKLRDASLTIQELREKLNASRGNHKPSSG